MKYVYVLLLVLLLSCGKEKIVLLPEITHSEITEIHDLSPAYLFYDETLPDSIEFNRSNLIGTTNWLFNIDKRLTLKQAIPKIMFLQEKKRNAKMHRNENAKNYYTCNYISIKNLGFIEFTKVYYHLENSSDYYNKTSNLPQHARIDVFFETSNKIEIIGILNDTILLSSTKDVLKHDIENLIMEEPSNIDFTLNFNKNLSFQDYISFKSMISELQFNNITTDNNEFIY